MDSNFINFNFRRKPARRFYGSDISLTRIAIMLIALLLVLLLSLVSAKAQLTGIKTVGAGKNYATIQAAISALNANGVGAGGVVFNVDASHTETFSSATAGRITATGTAGNTITFQKSGAGANPLITAGTGTGTLDGIIVIEGGDYVTFDGIDLQEKAANTNNTTRMEWGYAILKVSNANGAKYVTVKNCSVTLNKANTSSRGIYIANHTAASITALTITDTAGRHTNISIINNTISNAYTAVVTNSSASTVFDVGFTIADNIIQNFSDYGILQNYQTFCVISGNFIGNTAGVHAGMRIWECRNVKITGNYIYGITYGGVYGGAVSWFYGTNNVVSNNIVDSIIYTDALYYGCGLHSLFSSNDSIYNNRISRIYAPNGATNQAVNGIRSESTGKIYHNTIYLDCATGANNFGSNAIHASSTVDLRNNILYNASTYGEVCALRRTSANLAGYLTASNNNLFYAGNSSANNLIYHDGTNAEQTIDAFKSRVSGREQNSINETINFLSTASASPDFLRINTSVSSFAESRGVKIPGINGDIDDPNIRATYPQSGQANGGGTGPDLGADEFDGIPITEYSVGTGKDYATMAAAITAFNSGTFNNKYVIVNVTAGHTETLASGTAARITGTGTATHPVIFRKSGAGANPKITAGAGTGSLDGIIVIAGGDHITFDGIDVQENMANTNNTARMEFGYAILKSSATNGAKNITIKNSSITLNKTNTATCGIYINNHTASSVSQLTVNDTAGRHENIVLSNNSVTNVFKGIKAYGRANAAYYDTGLLIENSSISDFGGAITAQFNCMELDNQTAPVVTGNSVSNGTVSGAYPMRGINVPATCPNAVIKDNTVSNLTGELGVAGIATAAGTYSLVAANKIYGITTTGTGSGAEACGIRKESNTAAADIINNVIGGFSAPSSDRAQAQMGIYLTGNSTNAVNLFHNTVYLKAETVGTGGGSACVYANVNANLTMRNNILYNASTVGVVKAFVRSSTANLSYYQTASNNNLFYAGTPGVNNLIFYNQTTGYQTLTAFQTHVGPNRDSASISDTLIFLNTTDGSSTDYLRINPIVNSAAESAGAKITGFDDDFDAAGSRIIYPKTEQANGGGTAPDLGAYEFDGTLKTALGGAYTVGTGKNYATIAAAIADLNSKGVGSGGVTFNVDAGHTEVLPSVIAGRMTITGTAAKPVIFQKSGVGANPKITAASGTGSLDGIIVIAGGDHITFDGIDVQENAANTNNTTRMEWGYALLNASETDGAKHVTIKNCHISLNKANTNSRGIYVRNHTYISSSNLSITENTGRHDNNAFLSNTVSNAYRGISCEHNSNNQTAQTLFTISGNSVSDFTEAGIYLLAHTAAFVKDNIIRNTSASVSSLYGIYMGWIMSPVSTMSNNIIYDLTGTVAVYGCNLTTNGGSINVTGNKIYNITSSGSSLSALAYGIHGGSNTTIANNIIGNIQAPASTGAYPVRGIYLLSTGSAYHNTVYLNCTSTVPSFASAAVYANSSLTLRNNLFLNHSLDGKKVAFYYAPALSGYNTASNNNLFYAGTPSANNLIFSDGTNNDSTLALFRARLANNRDNQSLNEPLTFLNTTDGNDPNFLRINPAVATNIESAGVKITGQDDDIDNIGIRAIYPQSGQTRGWGIAPDLGAAEFDGARVPTVTSFTPTSAGTGMTVTITGTNLRGATAVKFGNTNATSFNVVNATTIMAVVAAGTTGSVTVTTAGGTATSAGSFTYVPAPTISSFTPTSAGPNMTVTITGTNFTGTTAVKFGNTNAASFTVVNATSITAVVATGATGSVAVTTAGGTATSAGTFTFVPAPTISGFTPATAGRGRTVTITGSNFTGATAVKFGGTDATSFNVVNATSITAVVDAGSTGSVTVTTAGGTGTRAGFTYSNTLSGTYTVGTGRQYATIANAIIGLNAATLDGNVTFNVDAGHTETFTSATAGRILATGEIGKTITFQKSGAGANPEITAGTGTGSADYIIQINGADYITFNGIDVQDTAANNTNTRRMERGYAITRESETNGAKNITIKNCNIALNKDNGNATYGIYATGPDAANNVGRNENLTIDSNTITNSFYGIYVRGTSSYHEPGLQIRGNTITDFGGTIASSTYGIYAVFQTSPYAQGNSISGGATPHLVFGFYFSSLSGTPVISENSVSELSVTGASNAIGILGSGTISKNRVWNIINSGTSTGVAIGISVSGTSTVSNNMVAGISAPNAPNTNIDAVSGIYLGAPTLLYHNTVYINSAGAGSKNAVYVANYNHTFINNIFYNASTTGTVRVYRRSANNLTYYQTASNNNLFYTGANNLIFSDGTNHDQTFAEFRARLANTRDNQSLSEPLTFLNTTDGNNPNFLRPATGNYRLGASIAGEEYDIAGTLRSTPPDIGAFEGREANRWIGGLSTGWNVQQNWDDSIVPSGSIAFSIDSNATNSPLLQGNLAVTDLNIPQGKTLGINGYTLTLIGKINGNGALKGSPSSGLVISGTGHAGPLSFDQFQPGTSNRLQNLTLNRGTTPANGGATLGNNVEVSGAVTVTNGTLQANGNLILVSDASGTARVAPIPATADLTGNVTVQRYVPAVTRRSRMLSSPVRNFDHSQLIDDIFITGTGGAANGFDASPTNSATIYTYQEDTSGGRGWTAAGHINHTLAAGQGALVFIRGDRTLTNWNQTPYPAQNEVTIDFVSQPINKGTISPAITYTSTGVFANDGWNMIGNPYPSQISWNQVAKSNVSPFYYSLDPVSGSYVADDGENLIASGQAFFVQAIGTNPAITFTESSKASSAPVSYFKNGSPVITVRMIRDSLNSDLLKLSFTQGTSARFHPMEDAVKMTNSLINLGSLANNDSILLQYDKRPLPAGVHDTIRLLADAGSGTYRFDFSGISSLDSKYAVLLWDVFTNSLTDLRTVSSYTFGITAATGSKEKGRFRIIFTNTAAMPVRLLAFNGARSGNDALLEWSTTDEKNNSHFIVERSADQQEWTEAGTVPAGENTSVSRYLFRDRLVFRTGSPAHLYYRLRQVDKNGAGTFSRIIRLSAGETPGQYPPELLVYPVPAGSTLFIEAGSEHPDAEIEVIDMAGNLVMSGTCPKVSGRMTLDIGTLNPGVYFLRYREGETRQVRKFIK